MNFASDNWAGASPAVMAALQRNADGFAPAYGSDALSRGVVSRFEALFETSLEVAFTGTGTAANVVSLSAAARPSGAILSSLCAHIHVDEWGAAEFHTGGMKIVPLPTRFGRIAPKGLIQKLEELPETGRFGRPTVLSLTQATEMGTLYSLDALAELSDIAHRRGLVVQMDGARFANALVSLGCTPAEMTWKAGIDILSFGGTKNGCWAAEAILCFKPDRFPDLKLLRARAGHLFSKSRFVAAQFEGYLEADLWLANARHANAMAQRLADGIAQSGAGQLGWDVEANEVFAVFSDKTLARLREAGAQFYAWPVDAGMGDLRLSQGEKLVRLVTSFATSEAEVDQFLDLLPDERAGLAAMLSPPI
ncbi:threonine aldolase family protein [Devosia enhydra]|nr:low specificity L-threonine aldolase [Devosia enhydra]